LSKKACTDPEGETWNSAALVVSTMGLPASDSTLIDDADCAGAEAVF